MAPNIELFPDPPTLYLPLTEVRKFYNCIKDWSIKVTINLKIYFKQDWIDDLSESIETLMLTTPAATTLDNDVDPMVHNTPEAHKLDENVDTEETSDFKVKRVKIIYLAQNNSKQVT